MKNNTNLPLPLTNQKEEKGFEVNKWKDFHYKLSSNLLSDNQISLALDYFKSLILLPIITNKKTKSSDLKLLILFKINTKNHQLRTISYMQTIELKDYSDLYLLFTEFWNLKNEDYHLAELNEIIFTYKIINVNLFTKILHSPIPTGGKSTNISPSIPNFKKQETLNFGGYNLPSTMDINSWGNCHFLSEGKAIVFKPSSSLIYHVELFNNYQLVELKLNDKILLTFKDTMNHRSDLSSFTRTLNNQEYIFEFGILILKKITKNVSFLSKSKRNMYNSKNFITMDLETRVINEVMSSYCVSIYDGKVFKSFYLTDYSNEKEMLRASILYLFKRKYHNHKIYLHNFSRFDSVFLLNVITDISNSVKPIIRDNNIINLRVDFAEKYSLYFRDSLLLLPGSLRSLAKNFEVNNKGLFPYKFVNNSLIPLNYVGIIPKIEFFDKITIEEYELYCNNTKFNNNNWNLRTETIKYCELDCLVLYQILSKFSDNIFKLFRIDILRHSTLSSLAFAIYRTNYLKDAKIPLIHGEIYNFIKQSYTGGSVDVYKPVNEAGEKVYRYDVNSLYPYAMKHFPMPTGNPTYFEGDILKTSEYSNKPYGIFEVDVVAPAIIKYPLLQTRIKTDNGYRTVAPLGKWSGVYFSDELYNASKYGYTFTIKRGYLFDRADIFSEYVDFLYDLKKNSTKGSPNYTISKLLLNSLYGRLGMNPMAEQHIILSNIEAIKLYPKIDVTNVLDLKNGKELLSFFTLPSSLDSDAFSIKNTSVVIASVITASARIHMSIFKTDPKLNIYYTDTDSIDVNQELKPKFIGSELGQMKLEHTFSSAIYLSPKMYGGKTEEYEIVRIKGLKNPIPYSELLPLLTKNSTLEIKQEKWYSDVSNGLFHIKDEIYTLMVTDNKRKLLYNKESIFIDTIPLILENGSVKPN